MSERELWAAVLKANIDDALGIFPISNIRPSQQTKLIENFYKKYTQRVDDAVNSYNPKILYLKTLVKAPDTLDCRKARNWMETSSFDDIVLMAGLDSLFVNKMFDYVQEAITAEKTLIKRCEEYRDSTDYPRIKEEYDERMKKFKKKIARKKRKAKKGKAKKDENKKMAA